MGGNNNPVRRFVKLSHKIHGWAALFIYVD
jgi:hypothetical protein